MTEFNEFISDMYLFDLSVVGRIFTWFNGESNLMRRINRFLLSGGLIEKWSVKGKYMGNMVISSHYLVLIKATFRLGSKAFHVLLIVD